MAQVAPASQDWLQAPPLQSNVHAAPAGQAWLQLPSLHSSTMAAPVGATAVSGPVIVLLGVVFAVLAGVPDTKQPAMQSDANRPKANAFMVPQYQ
jgi:hypothetical protein